MDILIKKDLERYGIYDANFIKRLSLFFRSESIKCNYVHRKILYHYVNNNRIRLLFWQWYKIHSRMTVSIGLNAKIGGGLIFIHPYNICIGDAIIGENCHIYQGVTIGANYKSNKDGQRHPRIGNNVKISPGSIILGPLTIGSNVVIGANSVVVDDVADDVIVGGVPAKIIRKYDDSRFG